MVVLCCENIGRLVTAWLGTQVWINAAGSSYSLDTSSANNQRKCARREAGNPPTVCDVPAWLAHSRMLDVCFASWSGSNFFNFSIPLLCLCCLTCSVCLCCVWQSQCGSCFLNRGSTRVYTCLFCVFKGSTLVVQLCFRGQGSVSKWVTPTRGNTVVVLSS